MKNTWKKILCGTMTAAMLLGTAPMAKAATPFTDVKEGAWYDTYVDYAYNNGLMAGTSDTAFSPNQTMTRGMLVTVLHSMAGKPAPANPNPFSDVGDAWYSNAVSWCYEHGVAAGTSDTTFSPNQKITREQMVTILHRYAETNGADVSKRADLSGYSDLSSVASYAADSFSWAVASGIIKGTNATTLAPKNGATRAECAVVLQRYHELLNGRPEPTEPAPTEPAPTTPPTTAPTEPKPTVHIHTWVKKECNHGGNTDDPMPGEGAWVSTGVTYPNLTVPQLRCTECGETGHWDEKFVCQECGWSCTESQAAAEGMDIVGYWITYHQYSPDCPNPSYDADADWVVDVPASDKWICSGCGEVTTTNPN